MTKESFLRRFFAIEREYRLVVLGLVGLLLIWASSFDLSPKASPSTTDSGAAYCHETEAKLREILGRVAGVGEVEVMVTLRNGVEYRYAKDAKTSSVMTYSGGTDHPVPREQTADAEERYLLVDGSGGKSPLVLTAVPPTIKGVVVVCSGAASPIVQGRVIEAVSTALGVSSLQVCVVPSENTDREANK